MPQTTSGFEALRAAFSPVPGYLDAASNGLPTRACAAAMTSAIADWSAELGSPASYDPHVETARGAFAELVDVPVDQVAIGATTAVFVGLIAASLPDGAHVVLVEDDFTSVTYPFLQHAHRGVTTTAVSLGDLPDAVARGCDAVAFSLAASRTGRIADADAVLTAARGVGALTIADLTQAAGWMPTHAGRFDVTVTSAYKWLGTPRGVAFMTAGERAQRELRPIHANWRASANPWHGVYGVEPDLATDAQRFGSSPAWLPFVGAAASLPLFAAADPAAVRTYTVGLANALLERLGLPASDSAIVALCDASGHAKRALEEAGCTVAGRGGGVRLAFHVWNDEADVDRAATALLALGAKLAAA